MVEALGLQLIHARNRISPTGGIKKLAIAKNTIAGTLVSCSYLLTYLSSSSSSAATSSSRSSSLCFTFFIRLEGRSSFLFSTDFLFFFGGLNVAPQFGQNVASSGSSAPHLLHFIINCAGDPVRSFLIGRGGMRLHSSACFSPFWLLCYTLFYEIST